MVHEQTDQQSKIENPEIDMRPHGHSISDKDDFSNHWGKDGLFKEMILGNRPLEKELGFILYYISE